MHAFVRLRLPEGQTAELCPGDLIGRVASAALPLDDPRVSEAHAMVSLRRGELYLLGLRRLIGHRGKPCSEVLLVDGDHIEIVDGLTLVVDAVHKPPRVMGIESPEIGVRPLGQVASLVEGPPLRLTARFVPGAAAALWSVGADQWRLRIGGGVARSVAIGDEFVVGGQRVTLCEIDLTAASHPLTHKAGGIDAPLRIVAHYDTVELHRGGRPAVTISGVGARLLSELVAFGGPVSWDVVAGELWRDVTSAVDLRRRWDVSLGRLRGRLRDGGIRGDLIRSDGTGQLQLLLYEGDRVDDRT